jgi:rhomboid protease GluP
MATDGDIDFKTYTREQLDSAVTRIDRQRYPINAQNLITEYQQRRIAEHQVAAEAAISGAAVLPDRMLSAPRPFTVMFEPTASFVKWLGPSRNDFHLVSSGSVCVSDALVRVTGRRFGVFLGVPIIATHDLGRRYIVNVETEGPVVRFELRVPDQRIRGLTIWLRNTEEAEALAGLLPVQRTADFAPQLKDHVEFEHWLIAQSPNTPVTYALLGICIFVYVGAAIGTNHLTGFDGRSLVRLGSNFGPYTTAGDWWRVLTCMFLHAGVIHLAFNMWALASFGPFVERLYGSVPYALLYLVAGMAGSLASVSWNPAINSVGASGAIFGLLGALMAAQMRSAGSFPPGVLRPLRSSSLIFTAVGLSAGFLSTGVDNAAHLGGVAAGFLLGLLLSRPVTGLRSSTGDFLRRLGFTGTASILLLGAGVAIARSSAAGLTGEGLYAATVHWFAPSENAALQRWDELAKSSKDDKWDADTYASRIEHEVIPVWREADARLARVDLPESSANYANLRLLRSVTSDRLNAYELAVNGLRQHNADMAAGAVSNLRRIDESVNKRIKALPANP